LLLFASSTCPSKSLHLFTFQTPILKALKNKKHKINSRNFTHDGHTFFSVFILEEVKDEI
jgi:hypothetical protein